MARTINCFYGKYEKKHNGERQFIVKKREGPDLSRPLPRISDTFICIDSSALIHLPAILSPPAKKLIRLLRLMRIGPDLSRPGASESGRSQPIELCFWGRLGRLVELIDASELGRGDDGVPYGSCAKWF
jgi:hypothetical protein